MTRNEASQIAHAIKTSKARCKMMRIGTGRHVEIGLYGADAARVAAALVPHGYKRTALSGSGHDRCDLLTVDR